MTYTKKELKNYLKDIVKGKQDATGFSFEYLSGHTAFHARLRIILTSEKIVHWKIPKGTQVGITEEKKVATIRETDFSPEELAAFIQSIFKQKIWDLENCTDRALPDTAMLSFSIKENENTLFKKEVWENCRNDDDRTKDLLKTLSAHLPQDWTPP